MGSHAPCVSRWHQRPAFQPVAALCFLVLVLPALLLQAEAHQLAGQQVELGLPLLQVAPEAEPPLQGRCVSR